MVETGSFDPVRLTRIRQTARWLLSAGVAFLTAVLLLSGVLWPLLPVSETKVDVGQMRALVGFGRDQEGGTFSVHADERGMALQLVAVQIEASRQPILRYRLRGFTSTMELVVVWRRQDDPEKSYSWTVRAPRSGLHATDLSLSPEWRGRIIELALAQTPVPHQVRDGAGFEPFTIEQIALQSPALSNSVAQFRDTLFAPQPWTQASINSLGRELQLGWRGPLPAIAGGFFAFVVVWWLLGRTMRARASAGRPVLVVFLLAWMVLDLGWHVRLSAQNDLSRKVSREGLQLDADLEASALRVLDWLKLRRPDSRALVSASGSYRSQRLAYFLAPLDVAAIDIDVLALEHVPAPDMLLLIHSSAGLSLFDGSLYGRDGVQVLSSVVELHQDGELQVLEYRPEETTPP